MCFSVFLFFFIFIASVPSSLSEDNFIVREVTIRPGGVARSETVEGFGITCKFDYTCQGGTGEEWHFTMVRSNELGRITCHIQRPSPSTSYLFFQRFNLSVNGPAKVVDGAAYADQTKLMPKEEYILDLSKNTLSQKDGKFTGHLVHASMEFELRSEL
ncbi:unnamed protein product [Hymenolepis diminuta]|uniref:DUF5727 domain-containing protein n=2 Tax=Hymenolepis diminuta TaxID=6216 RepID=A0A564YWS7_HYMDI|nr:unnamed protein product [Hymenolepis diminuta]